MFNTEILFRLFDFIQILNITINRAKESQRRYDYNSDRESRQFMFIGIEDVCDVLPPTADDSQSPGREEMLVRWRRRKSMKRTIIKFRAEIETVDSTVCNMMELNGYTYYA